MSWRPVPRLPPSSPVERAVRWLILTRDASYPTAAARFDVSVNSIRARIEYRFGSLELARDTCGAEAESRIVWRRCIMCRQPGEMDLAQHICRGCSSRVERADREMI